MGAQGVCGLVSLSAYLEGEIPRVCRFRRHLAQVALNVERDRNARPGDTQHPARARSIAGQTSFCLFRRLFLKLLAVRTLPAFLAPVHKAEWVVYA